MPFPKPVLEGLWHMLTKDVCVQSFVVKLAPTTLWIQSETAPHGITIRQCQTSCRPVSFLVFPFPSASLLNPCQSLFLVHRRNAELTWWSMQICYRLTKKNHQANNLKQYSWQTTFAYFDKCFCINAFRVMDYQKPNYRCLCCPKVFGVQEPKASKGLDVHLEFFLNHPLFCITVSRFFYHI